MIQTAWRRARDKAGDVQTKRAAAGISRRSVLARDADNLKAEVIEHYVTSVIAKHPVPALSDTFAPPKDNHE
jgi:hypothetical protein